MNKNKAWWEVSYSKGFTLIELLAVIVILAIIALISTPIVLDIIENTKVTLQKRSIEMYVAAVENAVARYSMSNNGIIPIGVYELNDSHNLTNEEYSIQVDYSGSTLTNGVLVIKSDGSIEIKNGSNNTNTMYNYKEGKVIEFDSKEGIYKAIDEEGRYIYRGDKPNNYIWIDEDGNGIKVDSELYRIISYENDGTIKVIRNESIGAMAWDSGTVAARNNENNTYCVYSGIYYGCNAWGNQNNTYVEGKLLENSFYYEFYADNKATNLSKNAIDKTVTEDSTLNTYLNGEWYNSLSNNVKSNIDNHIFNVGGLSYATNYVGGDKGLSKEKYEESLSQWRGNIGLITITEYVEASLHSNCTSVYSDYYYNENYWYADEGESKKTQHNTNWYCSKQNWFIPSDSWTLTAHATVNLNNRVWHTKGVMGISNEFSPDFSKDIYPVFYLKSNIDIIGDGTINNPYTIK